MVEEEGGEEGIGVGEVDWREGWKSSLVLVVLAEPLASSLVHCDAFRLSGLQVFFHSLIFSRSLFVGAPFDPRTLSQTARSPSLSPFSLNHHRYGKFSQATSSCPQLRASNHRSLRDVLAL